MTHPCSSIHVARYCIATAEPAVVVAAAGSEHQIAAAAAEFGCPVRTVDPPGRSALVDPPEYVYGSYDSSTHRHATLPDGVTFYASETLATGTRRASGLPCRIVAPLNPSALPLNHTATTPSISPYPRLPVRAASQSHYRSITGTLLPRSTGPATR